MAKNKFIRALKQCSTYFVFSAVFGAFILILGTLVSGDAYARAIGVAVIETKHVQQEHASLQQLFKDELVVLFKGEYTINFMGYAIEKEASAKDIHALLDQAYANSKTEMVLVLDMAANQMIGRRASFAKPTFLPTVINGQLSGYPIDVTSKGKDKTTSQGTNQDIAQKMISGKKNLNYVTTKLNFGKEFKTLHRIAPFRRAVLIADASLKKSIDPSMTAAIKAEAEKNGVNLKIIAYDGNSQMLFSAIPADTDAVLYGAFPTTSWQQIQQLIDGINAKKLVSFSLSGEEYVRMGALATNNPDTDWEKLARQTAIHMQEVFLGKAASSLPVFFQTSDRLMINMETSRKIRYAPGFDVLSEATLINEDKTSADAGYSLTDVAHKAVQANLSLTAQRLQVERAGEAVKEVRGSLLPRLKASTRYSTQKETGTTRSGAVAENSTDGSVTLTQSLFSEELWAAYAIQKYSHLSEKERLKETELDIVQSAVTAYLNVLREKTSLDQERYNLEITRQNHQLAKNRVAVGSSNASDLYRWESELATAKRQVLSAKSTLEQQRQILNRILDRPIAEAFTTTVETLENTSLLISDKRLMGCISNRYALEELTGLFVEIGLERAPELKQLEAQIAAYKRQLQSDQRAYWVPDVNLTGEYSTNFYEERSDGGISAEENDWRVGVELSLPLYEGGARSARKAQSRLFIKRLGANYRNFKNSIEQKIRSAAEAMYASHASIDFAKLSEKSSQKNYDLVSESYAQGRDAIVNVLDAQETLIEAREASMNSIYSFLIDLMNLQRAIGAFDFFLTDGERMEISKEVMARVNAYK